MTEKVFILLRKQDSIILAVLVTNDSTWFLVHDSNKQCVMHCILVSWLTKETVLKNLLLSFSIQVASKLMNTHPPLWVLHPCLFCYGQGIHWKWYKKAVLLLVAWAKPLINEVRVGKWSEPVRNISCTDAIVFWIQLLWRVKSLTTRSSMCQTIKQLDYEFKISISITQGNFEKIIK